MIYSYLIIPAEGLLLAIAIDILFGEPRAFINIRDTSQRISSWFLHKFIGKKGKVSTGFLIALATSIIILLPIVILLEFINYGIYRDTLLVFIYAFILTSTFRITSVGARLKPIIKYIENKDYASADVALSLITGTSFDESNAEMINSRIIETIAREYMDGIVGPFLYFIFFGIVGATIYRIICSSNEVSSGESFKMIQLGKFSSYAYAFLNWAASGIASGMIVASTFLLNLNVGKSSILQISRMSPDRAVGIVTASIASTLNIRLEHHNEYILNDNGFSPQLRDVKNSMKVYYLSIFLMLALVVIPLAFIMMYLYNILNFPLLLM